LSKICELTSNFGLSDIQQFHIKQTVTSMKLFLATTQYNKKKKKLTLKSPDDLSCPSNGNNNLHLGFRSLGFRTNDSSNSNYKQRISNSGD
jgi:hypothetical protein